MSQTFSPEAIEFLQKHRVQIAKGQFDELFSEPDLDKIPMKAYREIRTIFEESGIDPIQHMTYIPEYYFAGDLETGDPLTSYEVPTGIETISTGAFESCEDLSVIRLPAGIKEIQANAFYDCSVLQDVYYGGTLAQWKTIYISRGNAAIDTFAVIHCTDGDIDHGKSPVDGNWE